MRDAINNNPKVKAGIVVALLLVAVLFLMSKGGGEEEAETAVSEETAVATTTEAGSLPAEVAVGEATAGASATGVEEVLAGAPAPAPPAAVVDAYEAGRTIVLLIVNNDGIDDRLVRDSTTALARFPEVAVFVVPAAEISKYTTIVRGVGVEQVPALLVVTPRDAGEQMPTASVSYGFQSPASVAQAVIDAGYEGPILDYHP